MEVLLALLVGAGLGSLDGKDVARVRQTSSQQEAGPLREESKQDQHSTGREAGGI